MRVLITRGSDAAVSRNSASATVSGALWLTLGVAGWWVQRRLFPKALNIKQDNHD